MAEETKAFDIEIRKLLGKHPEDKLNVNDIKGLQFIKTDDLSVLQQENAAQKETNEKLTADLQKAEGRIKELEASASKGLKIFDPVKKAMRKVADYRFKHEGKDYRFIPGLEGFRLDRRDISCKEALKDPKLLAKLIDMKSGLIEPV